MKILFILSKSRTNKQGLAPIYCRLTYNGSQKTFSTGLFINPNHWNSKKQKALVPDDDNYTNNQLSLIKNKLNQAFFFLQVNDESFTVEDIYSHYRGEKRVKDRTILEAFELHNTRMGKLVGSNYARDTHYKFEMAKRHVANFISKNYKRKDMLLSRLNMKFITDFEFYLKSEIQQKQITVNKYIQRLRKIIKVAMIEDWLDKDPFVQYKAGKEARNIVYLSPEELQELENYQFAQKRLQQVAEMFLFCCYSGLAYQEMVDLRKEHIVKGAEGNLWIEMTRRKTNAKISVPLLKRAEEILLYKYDYEFPVISNQKFNSYLKEIAEIIGLNKRLTHHVARKTFATTVLLSKGVSMAVVSKLLGHSRIGITQFYYGEIIKTSIINQLYNNGLID